MLWETNALFKNSFQQSINQSINRETPVQPPAVAESYRSVPRSHGHRRFGFIAKILTSPWRCKVSIQKQGLEWTQNGQTEDRCSIKQITWHVTGRISGNRVFMGVRCLILSIFLYVWSLFPCQGDCWPKSEIKTIYIFFPLSPEKH